MTSVRARARVVLPLAAALAGLLLAACDSEAPASRDRPSVLEPGGEGAKIVAGEWWMQFTLGGAIFLGVVLLTLVIAVRAWRQPRDQAAEVDGAPGAGHWWIILGGLALPLVVLTASLVFSVGNLTALGASNEPTTTTIEVTGHRWWWEVRYPDEDFVTANEIRVPVGEPIRIVLRSNDVIHSLWLPEIHGKVDLIPGRENSMEIQATEAGIYRGICAEFCGLQHARMHFMLVAMPSDQYDAWVAEQQQPAPEPEGDMEQLGQEVFLGTECAYCHTIEGTAASGTVGPDLTHFGSRFTLAAGVLDNNAGNLGGWIADPQGVKPGVLMPATELSGEELTALIAYLRSLQ